MGVNRSIMTGVFGLPHIVTDDEIDEQGHANNVVYVGWMQDAAVAHSAALGWTSERYLQMGMGWVAHSHYVEYLRPAMPGDHIIIETHVADMKRATSRRVYRVIRPSDGEVLAKAETQWAFVDYATGKPKRIPAEIADAYVVASEEQEKIAKATQKANQ
jgi:acyl-CoA thioester hydrolase